MASVVERFVQMERCRTCGGVMPLPPAPRVCGNCGDVKITPRHGEWPHSLKVFLILMFAARHLFPGWRSQQDSWELLLIGHYERRHVNDRIIGPGVNPDKVYAIAVKEAEGWKLAGPTTEFL